MRTIVAAAAALLTTAAAPIEAPSTEPQAALQSEAVRSPASITGQECQRPDYNLAEEFGVPPGAQKLGELPPANLQLAVMQEVEGCLEPVIVGYGFGLQGLPDPAQDRARR